MEEIHAVSLTNKFLVTNVPLIFYFKEVRPVLYSDWLKGFYHDGMVGLLTGQLGRNRYQGAGLRRGLALCVCVRA